jgi:hypothetical protein
MNKPAPASAIASGSTIIKPTFIEGQVRRGPIDISEKLSIADTSDPTKPPTEIDILSVNIAPKYSDKPMDSHVKPTDYKITPTINGAIDRTAEINVLNDKIVILDATVVDLTDKLKTATSTLSATPVPTLTP